MYVKNLIGVNAQSDSINPSNCGERSLQRSQDEDDLFKIVGGTVAKVGFFKTNFSLFASFILKLN